MRIPWKAKSAAYAVLERVGDRPLWFAQKYVTRRSRVRVHEIKQSWQFHFDQLAKHDAKHILEFGGGKSLVQNLYLSRLGLDQTVIDLHPMVDIEQVANAIDALQRLGIDLPGHVGSLSDLESQYGIRYLAPVDMRESGFDSGGFDAIISTNTLEHMPTEAIASIWSESRRLLRPGGIVSAKIDYSDHYAHTDRTIPALNYLRFTEQEWRRYNHSNHYQNRLRHRHHLGLMSDAGFVVLHAEAVNARHADPADFHPGTLTGDPTDFFIDGYVVAQKPKS